MMFSAFCPTHDARVLMTRRNVTDFANSDDGPVLRWKCNCGHEGTLGRHGSVADPVTASPITPSSDAIAPIPAHSHR
jgi:hypothetical protein